MSGIHNLIAFLIAAAMVCFCAMLKLDREQFGSVIQLASTIVSGVAGAMIGSRMATARANSEARKRTDSGAFTQVEPPPSDPGRPRER